MKKGNIEFTYFEKGDYVRTPDGVGIVIEDEKEIETEKDLYFSEVIVQHKFSISSNPSNRAIEIERSHLVRITRREYKLEEV